MISFIKDLINPKGCKFSYHMICRAPYDNIRQATKEVALISLLSETLQNFGRSSIYGKYLFEEEGVKRRAGSYLESTVHSYVDEVKEVHNILEPGDDLTAYNISEVVWKSMEEIKNRYKKITKWRKLIGYPALLVITLESIISLIFTVL
mgnify:CR=1 FL=1